MSDFTEENVSIAGMPTIVFRFDGEVCSAGLAGARLHAECEGPGRARLTINDTDGAALADVTVHKIHADESITVSVMNIGSALLWSHARWCEAKALAAADGVPTTVISG